TPPELETQPLELFLQGGLGRPVDLVQRQPVLFGAQADGHALDAQDGGVEVALGSGEAAADGPDTGDVRDVPAVLAAGVDQDGLAVAEQGRVVRVVDHAAAGPAGDDGHVRLP